MANEIMSIARPRGALEGEAIIVPHGKAGIIIIPGSGPTDRNGNGPMGLHTDTYKLLAESLSEAGFSTLRIDKRGFFGSKNAVTDAEAVTIEDYANDVRLWHAAFTERLGASFMWIAGHSEGGLVALVAAARLVQPCGLILLSTPGRRISDLMREQFRRNPANTSYLPELDRLISSLERGELQSEASISAVLRPLFRQGLQRYMMSLFSYDPARLAAGLENPALVLQGDKDVQVTPQDARLLSNALPKASLKIIPGVTHMLKQDVPGAPFATYQDASLPLGAEVTPAIVSFIQSFHLNSANDGAGCEGE